MDARAGRRLRNVDADRQIAGSGHIQLHRIAQNQRVRRHGNGRPPAEGESAVRARDDSRSLRAQSKMSGANLDGLSPVGVR